MTLVPPIKSQGIKTKLVPWIKQHASGVEYDRWVEPFMGTGAVAFNIAPERALLCDSNPHLIAFYQAIQTGEVTASKTRNFLDAEGARLLASDGDHYYTVRERFNQTASPFDFLFLSRSCFNGLMRFNRAGGFNVPFCRKPNRFAKALVTKICNQIAAVSAVMSAGSFEFRHQEFPETLAETNPGDLVYCDPPYIGRHVDYFDSWTEFDEVLLHNLLGQTQAPFIMSTWLKNRYRTNDYVRTLWSDCSIAVREHYYHIGAKEQNRNAVLEALLTNFPVAGSVEVSVVGAGAATGADVGAAAGALAQQLG